MSILIEGMEMPKSCHSCPMCFMRFCQAGDRELSERETRPNAKRPEDCPLVPVPPHGRLIDADALMETTDGIWDCNDLYFQPNDKICDPNDCKGCKWRETMDCFRRMVRHAPTIIPAEDEHTMDEFMYGQEGNPNDGSM